MMRRRGFVHALAVTILGASVAAPHVAAQDDTPSSSDQTPSGPALFAEACAECHDQSGNDRVPGLFSMRALSPRAIVQTLESGVMRTEGETLTPDQRILLAEYLTGRAFSTELLPEAAFCSGAGPGSMDMGAVSWMGWGGNLEGTGYQSAARAGLSASDVPDLELRWAFAFPDASEARTKPTVVGDVVLVGDQFGNIYAIEQATGCVRWTFEADSGVRGAILVDTDAAGRSIAYFVDYRTSAYALDVAEGSLVWKTRVGWHAVANNTGSPALHDGRLFVPISSMEVATAANPAYECCTSSGAVAALDASTGDVEWYHRVIPGFPEPTGQNSAGTQLWGPAGAPVWSSPTIDVERGLVYIGTGENYTRPTTASSDAIVAVDIETGELAWSFQATESDAFTMACTGRQNRENCPSPPGPDLDFGMAPMLVTREDGKDILVAGQKSGVVWALDPDASGEVLWSTRVGKGGALGGIHWGMATDGRLAYAANADRGAVIVNVNPDRGPSPGLYAIDLMTGDVVWSASPDAEVCAGRRGCFAANSAAPTVIPGVVFAGGLDGHIRAHSTEDGRVLWDFDTATEFETVNGVPGRGGAIDGAGPVVANGLMLTQSGYGAFGQMPGNVLLAFSAGGRGGG